MSFRSVSMLLAALCGATALPVTADPAGLELARSIHFRPDGDDYATLTRMTLKGDGRDRVRQLYSLRRDGPGEGDVATLIRFIEPRDIKGTGLLTIDISGQDDSDQWVYLPALGRDRRVSSQRKGGRFVGSDVYYEDLRDRDPAKDRHRIIGTESINGKLLTVLESIPIDADSSVYSRRVGWIDLDNRVPMRLDYYQDGGDQAVKRFEATEVRLIDGIWTTVSRRMSDLKNATVTELSDLEMRYNQGIPASLFSVRHLRKESSQERKWRP